MSRKTNGKDECLEEMLRNLKLLDIRENYQEAIEEAIESKGKLQRVLDKACNIGNRGQEKATGRAHALQAGFDYIKALDEIEYEFSSINYQRIKELGTLEFMDRQENIIIIGPPGVGKSMIATGIGINACKAGKRVIFSNAKELTDVLYDSMKEGRLKDELKRIDKAPLLIVDELSYLKMDKEERAYFFKLFAKDMKKLLIITTNLTWQMGRSIYRTACSYSYTDRLVHHCHVINITGDSFRVKEMIFAKQGRCIVC